MALKHALVWMMSLFRHFNCWFSLRCTRNCRSPLCAQTSSVSRHGKQFPVLIDVCRLFCIVLSLILIYLATCSRWIVGSCLQLVCLLRFGIWFSIRVCHCREVCCWTLQCCHLYICHSIWFSWSVICCCLGCRLLLDLPTRLIHDHQWWALSLQGLCHHHAQSDCPQK